jgi:hypothetical protein
LDYKYFQTNYLFWILWESFRKNLNIVFFKFKNLAVNYFSLFEVLGLNLKYLNQSSNSYFWEVKLWFGFQNPLKYFEPKLQNSRKLQPKFVNTFSYSLPQFGPTGPGHLDPAQPSRRQASFPSMPTRSPLPSL